MEGERSPVPVRRTRVERTGDVLLIGAFVVGIGLPPARHLLGPARSGNADEARATQSLPELRAKRSSLLSFPVRFEQYYRDAFGFRNELIAVHNRVKLDWLHTSPAANVVVGKGGWLYYSGGRVLEDHRGLAPLTDEHLRRWAEALRRRREWLAERGGEYLVVIVPEKHTIYPEFLPDGMAPVGPATRLDQFISDARVTGAARVLDLRGDLRGAKPWSRLYHRGDTHWNERGAYVGYRAIMAVLAERHPELAPFPPEDFEPGAERLENLDLVRMIGMRGRILEENLTFRPRRPRRAFDDDPGLKRTGKIDPNWHPFARQCPAAPPVKAVVLRDSFATLLAPYLAEHFRRSVFLWQKTFDYAVIDRERPDVVIHEMGERQLRYLPPEDVRLEYYEREKDWEVVE